MAEAGPSNLRSAGDIDTKQCQDEDKSGKKFSQSKNNSRSRQANYNQSSGPKPKKVQAERESAGNDYGKKQKNRPNPRARENAKPQGKIAREAISSQIKEDSKPDMNSRNYKSNPDGDSSHSSKRSGGNRQNPKAHKSYPDGKSRPQSGRGQQFGGNYSRRKPALGSESIHGITSQLEASTLLQSQPSGLNPFKSYGVVSNGVYVPKNKLQSAGQGSCKEQFGKDFQVMKNQTDFPRNSNASKRFDYSYYVGGTSKQASNDMDKVAAPFQAVSMNVQGQSSVQAGVLIEQLTTEKYECMVCCEVIRCSKAVWSCSNCFHIFHLYCIKRWARSPTAAIEGEGIL